MIGATSMEHKADLGVLLSGLAEVDARHNVAISHLSADSRTVCKGGLFFAMPGARHDGRSYMREALASGASAVVFDAAGMPSDTAIESADAPLIGIPNLRRHVGAIADVFYDRPSADMHVAGITGTNGKTTCALLAAKALNALGRPCGVIGTLGAGWPENLERTALTTPDAISVHRQAARLRKSGANCLCLEVSSHALDQFRVQALRFDTVALTNLTQDHLDYHGTMANYRASKARLFTDWPSATAVINLDDPFGRALQGQAKARREITYGRDPSAELTLQSCRSDAAGLRCEIAVGGRVIAIRSRMLGHFNAMNLTAVAGILLAFECKPAEIETALNSVAPIDGRMDLICGAAGAPDVVVDYAHSPDGLEAALSSLVRMPYHHIVCVFGCGGQRDRGKRPIMGAVAERFAHRVILTDDNPRHESPEQIVQDIMAGMRTAPEVIHDREQAIRRAIERSGPDDVVLVAGKGHEDTQTYQARTIRFNDRGAVQRILRQRP